jgi:hypothetical protein
MMLLVENYANHIKNELKVKTQNTQKLLTKWGLL